MNKRNILVAGAALLALLGTLPSAATAGGYHGHRHHHHHHGGVRWGLSIGVPLAVGAAAYYGPRYVYPPPVYYQPAPVVVTPAPVTYVEQTPQVAAAPSQGTWYYCGSAQAYYPYVKQCAEGWQQVPATPPR